MPNWFWRILIALVVAIFIYWIVPPVAHILGFPISGDIETVLHALVACGAVLYILFGRPVPNPWA
jgi:hypothetical protein